MDTTAEKTASVWRKSNWAKWKRKAKNQKKIKDECKTSDSSNLYILAENLSIEDEDYYPEGDDMLFRTGSYSMSCSSSNSSEVFFTEERKATPLTDSKPQSEISLVSDQPGKDGLFSPSISVDGSYADDEHAFDTSSEIKQKTIFKMMERIHLNNVDSFKSEEDTEDTSTIGSPCATPDSVIDMSRRIYKSSKMHNRSPRYGMEENMSRDFNESHEAVEKAFNSLFNANEEETVDHPSDNSDNSENALSEEGKENVNSEPPRIEETRNELELVADNSESSHPNDLEDLISPSTESVESGENFPNEAKKGEEKDEEGEEGEEGEDLVNEEPRIEIEEELVSFGKEEKKNTTLSSSTSSPSVEECEEIAENKKNVDIPNRKYRSKSFGSRPNIEAYALKFFQNVGSDFIKELLETNASTQLTEGEEDENFSKIEVQFSPRANLYCFAVGVLISLIITLFMWLFVLGLKLEGQLKLKMVVFYAFVCLVFFIVSTCIISTLRVLVWLQKELTEIKNRLPVRNIIVDSNTDSNSEFMNESQDTGSESTVGQPSSSELPVGEKVDKRREMEKILLVKTRISRLSARHNALSKPSSPTVLKYHSDAEVTDINPRILSRSLPTSIEFSPRGNRDLVLVRRDSRGSESPQHSRGSGSPTFRPPDIPKLGFRNSEKPSHRSPKNRQIIPDSSLWETRPNQVRLGILDTNSECNEACVLFVGKQVLVVDDNAINRRALGNGLQNLGMVVEFAGNGQEAMDLLSRVLKKFFCIFMDLHMPSMDGYEATSLIRKMEKENKAKSRVPIIGLTGDVFGKARRKCLEFGMDELLIKPVSHEKIERTLKKYLPK